MARGRPNLERTTAYRLIEKLLGEPLDAYVLQHRREERSWRYIVRKLNERTGAVTVSSAVLAEWFRDEDPAAVDQSTEVA